MACGQRCGGAAGRRGGPGGGKARGEENVFITTFQYKMNENFKHLGDRRSDFSLFQVGQVLTFGLGGDVKIELKCCSVESSQPLA